MVRRDRLYGALDRAMTRRLLLISAPAGFGKTTLLADWRARLGPRADVAWVTLDGYDNDPTRLWRHVAGAVTLCRPASAERALGELITRAPQLGGAVATLVNALAREQAGSTARPLVIILDDYQTITVPALHENLTYAIDRLPDGVVVAVLTRADPPLPLARWRVRVELEELRAADLRFTPVETAEFLAGALGQPVSEATATLAHTRTEGWPAALRLAAMAARQEGDPETQLRRLLHVDTFVVEFLTQEVLRSIPDEGRDFLLRTSVADLLSAGLCDAITGTSGSGDYLDRLERSGFFVTRVDGAAGWYRFHPLLGHALRSILRAERPTETAHLCARASDWHASHGNALEAIDFAREAGDYNRVAASVGALYRDLIAKGELGTLRRILAGLPPEVVQAHPRLALAHACANADGLSAAALERELDAALAGLNDLAPAERERLTAETATVRAVLQSARGDPDDVARLVATANLPARQDDPLLRQLEHQALGNAHRLAARMGEAVREYAALLDDVSANQPNALTSVTLGRMAWALAAAGKLREAERRLAQSLAHSAPEGEPPADWAAEPLFLMADVRRARWLLTEAGDCAARATAIAERADDLVAQILHARITATLRLGARDEGGARVAIARARALAAREDNRLLVDVAELHAAWLAIALRDLDAAVRWEALYAGGMRRRLVPLYRLEGDLLLARLSLARGHPGDAAARVDQVTGEARELGCHRAALEALVLRAVALRADGRLSQARDTALTAARLAEPEGWVSVFADEGAPLRELLVAVRPTLAREGAPPALRRFVERLIVAAAGGRAQGADMVEAMTPRETEVLGFIARGAANDEIARALRISLGTVKAHTSRVYGKLGARNRIEAAQRARELGLVED